MKKKSNKKKIQSYDRFKTTPITLPSDEIVTSSVSAIYDLFLG